MKEEKKLCLHTHMVLWPIRAHVLFELFYNSIWCVNFTYLLLTECKVHSECVGQKSPLKKGGSVTYNTN